MYNVSTPAPQCRIALEFGSTVLKRFATSWLWRSYGHIDLQSYPGPLLLTSNNFSPMHGQVITCLISNFIPHSITDVVNYPWRDWIWTILVKGPQLLYNQNELIPFHGKVVIADDATTNIQDGWLLATYSICNNASFSSSRQINCVSVPYFNTFLQYMNKIYWHNDGNNEGTSLNIDGSYELKLRFIYGLMWS